MGHANVDSGRLAHNSRAGNFIRKHRRGKFGGTNRSKQAARNRATDDVHAAHATFERFVRHRSDVKADVSERQDQESRRLPLVRQVGAVGYGEVEVGSVAAAF